MCQISVITSVYNCEEYIAETIKSVQDQTYEDWEFILIDDCSRDKSADIIKKFAARDRRIKYVKNPENKGQVKNLNTGIRMAKGKYIARLDHDDICDPQRFKIQMEYMKRNPEIVLVGSWIKIWENGKVLEKTKVNMPINTVSEAKFATLFCSIMAHSSFFIRKSAMTENNIWYKEKYKYAEDFALIEDLANVGAIFVINRPLVTYRVFPGQVTQQCSEELKRREREKILLDYLSTLTLENKEIYKSAIIGNLKSKNEIKEIENVIIEYAKQCQLGREISEIYNNVCVQQMYRILYDWQVGNFELLRAYAESPFRIKKWIFSYRGLSLIKKCILRK